MSPILPGKQLELGLPVIIFPGVAGRVGGAGETFSPFGNRWTASGEMCPYLHLRWHYFTWGIPPLPAEGRREDRGEVHWEAGSTGSALHTPLPRRAGRAATINSPRNPTTALPTSTPAGGGGEGGAEIWGLILCPFWAGPEASPQLEAGLGPREAEQFGPSGADCCPQTWEDVGLWAEPFCVGRGSVRDAGRHPPQLHIPCPWARDVRWWPRPSSRARAAPGAHL